VVVDVWAQAGADASSATAENSIKARMMCSPMLTGANASSGVLILTVHPPAFLRRTRLFRSLPTSNNSKFARFSGRKLLG
jgi:hypothetical protein